MASPLLIYAATFGCAFLVAWLLTAALLRWVPRLGLVDHPSERKFHRHVMPKGGGLAIYVSLLAATGLWAVQGLWDGRWLLFLGVCGLVVLLGLMDDFLSLPWQLRLAVQSAAALLLFGWPPQTGWLPPALALIWVVGLLNAFNMLDNMDALSGGVAWVTALAAAAFIILRGGGVLTDLQPAVLPYLMMLGALLGFLWFNRPPARIYMGDAGSTLLGFFFGIRSLQDGFARADTPESWAVPLCLLAVPWYDLIAVVSLRLSQGRSPFHADKQHLSHRLVGWGLSSPAAVAVIHLLTLASCVGGLLLSQSAGQDRIVLITVVAAGWAGVALVDYVMWRKTRTVPTPARAEKEAVP
jgi:UDP-GlcNAc:undecaprenyl-phosphate GlcNAc-1-phosphate transferase